MKRLAIVIDTFHPDKNSATSLIEDLINELANNYQIVVFCASSGATVTHSKAKVFNVQSVKSSNLYLRFIKENILPIKFLFLYLLSNERNFDKVIVYSPSIFLAPFGYLISKDKKNFTLLLRDIFPDWAISTGIIRNRLVIFYLNSFKNLQFKLAGKIAVQSKNDESLIDQKFRNKVHSIRNWGEFKKNCFNNSKNNNILYLGNLGLAQDYRTVLSIIESTPSKNFTFYGKIFCDDGSEYNNILKKQETNELTIFQNQYFAGLVSLSKSLPNSNIPGKLIKYLEYGLPILLLDKQDSYIGSLLEKYQVGKLISDKASFESAIRWIDNLETDLSENCIKILSEEFSKKNIHEL